MSLVTLGDIRTSVALLTRIPVKAEFDRASQATWAYPLAGAAVAIVAGAILSSLLWLGVDAMIAAGIWIALTVVLTGAMHEDGLADCADGFWGGFEKARRLEIMKDSQIGSYGVIALALSLGTRWLAVGMILESGGWFWTLLAVEVLSRSVIPGIMHGLPHARNIGLSHAQGRPAINAALIAAAIGFSVAFIALGWIAIKLCILVVLTSFAAAALAQRKIGGQTGDVLGAAQQIALLVSLIALA